VSVAWTGRPCGFKHAWIMLINMQHL
jgi:hypothetical protein